MSSICKAIFVHGWATDSRVWQAVAGGFRRAVFCGLPGHGIGRRWTERGLQPAVDELSERVKASGEGELVGIGWSLGAKVLIRAVTEHRIALKGLVLVGATPSFVKREGFPHGQSPLLVKRMLADLKCSPQQTLKRFYRLNFTERELSTPSAVGFLSMYDSAPEGFGLEDMARALETLMEVDLRDALCRIRLPVLVLHGTEDAVCPPACAEYLKGALKEARLEWFEGCGHAPFVTEPERFIQLTRRFMDTL